MPSSVPSFSSIAAIAVSARSRGATSPMTHHVCGFMLIRWRSSEATPIGSPSSS